MAEGEFRGPGEKGESCGQDGKTLGCIIYLGTCSGMLTQCLNLWVIKALDVVALGPPSLILLIFYAGPHLKIFARPYGMACLTPGGSGVPKRLATKVLVVRSGMSSTSRSAFRSTI